MGKHDEDLIAFIRSSRKAYIPYYLMVIIVLIVIIFIRAKGLVLQQYILIASLVFIILVIKVTELHRMTHHYEIHTHYLEKVEGIIVRKHKRMGFGSISQMHLMQTPWHKLLGIGTVEIGQFSETIRTEIKNINKPKDFMTTITRIQRGHGGME